MLSVLRALVLGLCSAMTPAFAPAQEIVLGQTLSLTGASANVARDLQRGRQACVDWVNSHGGVRGRSLKLLTRDDQGDAELAVKFAQELADGDGAVALLGPMGPVVNAALLKWANEQAMPVLGPYGGDIEIRRRDFETAFFLTANQSAEAERLAAHVVSLGLRRVVIAHGTDSAGRAALLALEEALAVLNVPALALLPVKSDGSDAVSVAHAVSRTNAQAVLLATSGRTTA
jgi:ABC-type branched-subunit amino acid transport system substrate-binding protein